MKSKLALVSLILGIFSFLHLLGIEKAVLAIIFGAWALKEIEPRSKKIAWIGISLGLVYLIVVAIVVIFYFPEITSLLEKIE
jgi:hypothetical protein